MEEKYLTILTNFLELNNIEYIKAFSLEIEGVIFIDIIINLVFRFKVGGVEHTMKQPTYFISFKTEDIEYQFEIPSTRYK